MMGHGSLVSMRPSRTFRTAGRKPRVVLQNLFTARGTYFQEADVRNNKTSTRNASPLQFCLGALNRPYPICSPAETICDSGRQVVRVLPNREIPCHARPPLLPECSTVPCKGQPLRNDFPPTSHCHPSGCPYPSCEPPCRSFLQCT